MKVNRPLPAVIQAIKILVPSDYEKKDELFKDLDWCAEDSSYKAPEEQHISWGRLAEVLTYTLGDLNTDWTEKLMLLMQNKLDYKEVLAKVS